MTHVKPYDSKYKHSEQAIALSIALQTGRSAASARNMLARWRLGHVQIKQGKKYASKPRLAKSDWSYQNARVYYNDCGRDKIAYFVSKLIKTSQLEPSK